MINKISFVAAVVGLYESGSLYLTGGDKSSALFWLSCGLVSALVIGFKSIVIGFKSNRALRQNIRESNRIKTKKDQRILKKIKEKAKEKAKEDKLLVEIFTKEWHVFYKSALAVNYFEVRCVMIEEFCKNKNRSRLSGQGGRKLTDLIIWDTNEDDAEQTCRIKRVAVALSPFLTMVEKPEINKLPACLKKKTKKKSDDVFSPIVGSAHQLVTKNGKVILNFGKHHNKTVQYVAEQYGDYLEWILDQGKENGRAFTDPVKSICQSALDVADGNYSWESFNDWVIDWNLNNSIEDYYIDDDPDHVAGAWPTK